MSSPLSSVLDLHWRTLRYFNAYRFCIALLLFVSSLSSSSNVGFSLLATEHSTFHLWLTGIYGVTTALSLFALYRYQRHFNAQLTLHVIIDIVVVTLLMYT